MLPVGLGSSHKAASGYYPVVVGKSGRSARERLTQSINQMISVRKNSCNKDGVLITYAISFISPLLTLLGLAVFIH